MISIFISYVLKFTPKYINESSKIDYLKKKFKIEKGEAEGPGGELD